MPREALFYTLAILRFPTTFRGYTSVAAKLVKKSKRTRIFPNWVLSAERKTQQWRVAAVVGWRLAFFQNAARSALLHYSYSSLSYNVLPVGVGCGHWSEYSQPGQTKARADAFANLQKKRKQTPAPIRFQTPNQENPSNCANRVL